MTAPAGGQTMAYVARWRDGEEYRGDTPEAVVRSMADGSPFTRYLNEKAYMRSVALRVLLLMGVDTRCNDALEFIRDLEAHGLVTYFGMEA